MPPDPAAPGPAGARPAPTPAPARRLRARVLVGLVAAVAAMAAVAGFALTRLAAAERARARVDHSHVVLDVIARLAEANADGGASARSYLLSREEHYLAPLAAADTAVRAAVERFAAVTRENPTQQRRVPELRRLVGARFARLHGAAGAVRAAPAGPGVLTRELVRAVVPSDSLNALVARLRDTERDLLARRAAAEASYARVTRLGLYTGLLGGSAVVAAVIVLLWTDAGRRVRAEAERDRLILGLQDAHEELEAQNEELVVQSEELVVQSERLMRQSDELQGARDYLEAVLGHMADGVIAFDERGTAILCNPAAQHFLGLPHGATPVAQWSAYTEWFDAEGAAPVAPGESPVARVRGGGTVREDVYVVAPRVLRAGVAAADAPRRRTVAATGRPVRDRTGRYRGAILVLHDVTDQKSAERLKNELVSVVSHELRTPLTSIRGSLGLLEGGAYGALPDPVRRLVIIGRTNTDRLIRLVNDLLDLEKLQAGRMELRDAPLRVMALVATSVEGVRSFAAENEVRVQTWMDAREGEALEVRGDADRLTQVLTNLLSNAIKYSPAGASVAVRVSRPRADVVRLAVQDEGPGIAEHDLPRLFQRFQQIDGSDTRRHGGTGLGLAISKDLVEQHGGQIGAFSHPGEGALFWVELPCRAAEAAPPVESAGPAAETRASGVAATSRAAPAAA
jgi:signal transduction histidine kinase